MAERWPISFAAFSVVVVCVLAAGLAAASARPVLAAEESYELPEGVTLESSVDRRGWKTDVYTDVRNAIRVTTVFNLNGVVERMDETTLGGAPIDSRVFESGRFFHETFAARDSKVHRRLWIERLASANRMLLFTIEEKQPGKTLRYSYMMPEPDAFAEACHGEFLDWQPDGGITPALLAPLREASEGLFDVDSNCDDYRSPTGATMADELQKAVKGLLAPQCLPAHRPGDVARLLSLLQAPVEPHPPNWGAREIRRLRVSCEPGGRKGADSPPGGSQAESITCASANAEADFPRINVNSTIMNRKGDQLGASALGHELMHLLGYPHGENPDVAYITEFCCFEQPPLGQIDAAARKNACAHLGQTWETMGDSGARMAYGRDFAGLMMRIGHGHTVLRNELFAAIDSGDPNHWAVVLGMASSGATPATRSIAEALGLSVPAYVLGRAALGGSPALATGGNKALVASLAPQDASVRRAADDVAQAIVQAGKGDSPRARAALLKLVGPDGRPTDELIAFCRRLRDEERFQVSNVVTASLPQLILVSNSTSVSSDGHYDSKAFDRAAARWGQLCE